MTSQHNELPSPLEPGDHSFELPRPIQDNEGRHSRGSSSSMRAYSNSAFEVTPANSVSTPDFSASSVELPNMNTGDTPRKDEVVVSSHEAHPSTQKPLWRLWAIEMVAMTLSFLCFMVIIIVLYHFNNQSLPNWPLSITLNTFLAFFTALGKAALMIPVSISISEARWSWFDTAQPLYDFQLFDQASRGSWGSVLLLRRVRFKHIAAIGALLMVASAVTSPITQLAIQYPRRDVVSTGVAFSSAINSYNSSTDYIFESTRKALQGALAADMTYFQSPVPLSGALCSTGNCTFDRYQSLGICTKVANISSHLSVKQYKYNASFANAGAFNILQSVPGQKFWRASLPDGYDMWHQSPYAALSLILSGNKTYGFGNDIDLLQTRVASFVLMYTTPLLTNAYQYHSLRDDNEQFLGAVYGLRHEALEILFHVCVQSFETKVSMGVEDTRMVDSLAKPTVQDGFALELNCTQPGTEYIRCMSIKDKWNETLYLDSVAGSSVSTNSSSKGAFFTDYGSMETVALRLWFLMSGYGYVTYDPVRHPNAQMFTSQTDFINTIFKDILFSAYNLTNRTRRDGSVRNIYDGIATSISTVLRTARNRPSDYNYTQGAFNVSGRAWNSESYISINWGWIAFLAVELVLGAGFLALTMYTHSGTRKAGQEDSSTLQGSKDSSLATLAVLGDECRSALGGGLQPIDEMKNISKGLMVKLEGGRIIPAQSLVQP